jgi:hypothetical protein
MALATNSFSIYDKRIGVPIRQDIIADYPEFVARLFSGVTVLTVAVGAYRTYKSENELDDISLRYESATLRSVPEYTERNVVACNIYWCASHSFDSVDPSENSPIALVNYKWAARFSSHSPILDFIEVFDRKQNLILTTKPKSSSLNLDEHMLHRDRLISEIANLERTRENLVERVNVLKKVIKDYEEAKTVCELKAGKRLLSKERRLTRAY